MENISTIINKELDRLNNLSKTIKTDIENFEKNYENEMQEVLSNAENFDADSAIIPDSQADKNKQKLFDGAGRVIQGDKLDISTYVGAFRLVSGSAGLLKKGFKNLFKASSKIHISDIPSDKVGNALTSHNIKAENKKPYVLIDNGENGLNSVIYSKKGISVSNTNLNKNFFFDWKKIEKFDLKQIDDGVFVFFNNKDNINLKYFYEGKQSQLGLLFYIAQSIKNLNEKPKELEKTLPEIKILSEKLKTAKEKIEKQEKISISEYTQEYEFDNLNSFLFYKMEDADLSNFVKINYHKFNEFLSQQNNSLEIDEIVDLLQHEFNDEIFYQDVNKEYKDKIENRLIAIGSDLSKYNKQKEFIKTIKDFGLNKNPEIKDLYQEIKNKQLDKTIFTNTIREIEEDREAYLEYKRKRDTKITVIVIVAIIAVIAIFVVIMNLTQN